MSRGEALEDLSQRLTFHILDQWQELEAVVESYELHRKSERMGSTWVRDQTRSHADLNARGLKPAVEFVTVGANARAAEEFILRSVQRLSRRLPPSEHGLTREQVEWQFQVVCDEADRRLHKERELAVAYYEEVINEPEKWKRWPSFWAPSTFRDNRGGE